MRIFQVDAFTECRFAGNPATVVLDADGQPDSMLAAIAREFAHAETAFVLAASAPDHDLRLRFFNSRKEAPFVGHATIAAHAVLLKLGMRAAGICRQRSGTGILEVAAQDGVIEFRQGVPRFDAPLAHSKALRVAGALRLESARLHPSLPACIARKGSSRLLIPVADPQLLDALAPDFEALLALGQELETDGFFVFAAENGAGGPATVSRMFCPALGIPEDPVSGNAHAMLAAYLRAHGLAGGDAAGFTGHQGRQMRRPGEVRVRMDVEQGELRAVRIGGRAVIVSEGVLTA